MQIEVNRRALMRGLQAANSVVERRTTAPILSSLLMRANGSVELIGTNLDMERRVQVPIADGKGAGEYLIEDPRSLLAVLKQASSKTVQLTADPDARDERMQWCAGIIKTRGRRDMDPGDFPMMHMVPQFARATVGADFLRAVRRIFPAIGTEETRFYLNGIAMRHLGGWSYRLAATDGHRLHIAQVELPDVDGDQWPGDVIIPRRAVLKLIDIVAASDAGAVIDFGSYLTGNAAPGKMPDPAPKHDRPNAVRIMDRADMIVSKLIDGTFPDVMRVVPAGVQTSVRVKTSDLRRAVAAASAGMVVRYSPAIRIAVGGGATDDQQHGFGGVRNLGHDRRRSLERRLLCRLQWQLSGSGARRAGRRDDGAAVGWRSPRGFGRDAHGSSLQADRPCRRQILRRPDADAGLIA